MKAIVTASARFYITYEGRCYIDNASLGYEFWKRYLAVYDAIYLFVRAKHVKVPPNESVLVSGPGVEIIPCTYFEGPWHYMAALKRIKKDVKVILNNPYALHLRLPCPIGFLVFNAVEDNRPYAAEVVGDPWDVFSPGSVRHILRPFLRIYFTYKLKKACKNAVAALYVTNEALQRRYPCGGTMIGASNVNLKEVDYVGKPRTFGVRGTRKIIYVGTLNQLYKAPDILIKAVGECVRQGLDIRLEILGDGKYRGSLERLAENLHIGDRVAFLGMAAREEVFHRLDGADLFVLPSKTEGLPRAMLEAMARGLPCIGTTVGGIPELLPPEDLVPPGNVRALAYKIMEVLKDPQRMDKMSARNLAKAREYAEVKLQAKRERFYSLVKEKTEEWLRAQEGQKGYGK